MVRLFLILFLFSNHVFLQNKGDAEQTKFDFPGYTLKKCLGSELSKPKSCLLYTSPSPRDKRQSRMPSSA